MNPSERLAEHYCFTEAGQKYVLDVNALTVFEIDTAVGATLEALQTPGLESPQAHVAAHFGDSAAGEALQDLRDARLLIADENAPPEPEKPHYTAITLNVTHGCNLRCTYCFAQQGDYRLGPALMDKATARKAIDWLAQQVQAEHGAFISFFGGEPMLNMRTVRGTVEYASRVLAEQGKTPAFHIVTNGTLLTERNVEYLARQAHFGVQVSMDGLAEVNDRYRIFPTGRGSHDVVAAGIRRLKHRTGRAMLRATIHAGHADFGRSLAHMIDDLGATAVAFEPAEHSPGHGESIDAAEVAAINAEWSKIAEQYAQHVARRGRLFPVLNLSNLLQKIHRRKKVIYGCTAGYGHVTVVPGGDIYPCHRFVGEAQWRMGNVHEGTFDMAVAEQFAANTVDNRRDCRHCWARYLCGGRCAHEAQAATGTLRDPDPTRCELERHLVALALHLYVRLKPYQETLYAGEADAGD